MFSLIKGLTMTQEELDKHYMQKRSVAFKKTGGVPRHLKLHNVFHWMLLPCIYLLRKLGGISLAKVSDERMKVKGPIIYACTHIGGVDIETAFEAIKYPCWLFLGDPKEVYKNLDGFMLGLNGVICLETRDKKDRYIAKETAIQLLKHGGSLMIFPEGAWNISENLPVAGLFLGTAEMALRSNAQIVPIAMECYGRDMYVSIGKNISVSDMNTDKKELTQLLRDTLASLKWEIWEHLGVKKRSMIPTDYSRVFVNAIINGNKEMSYSVKDVEETMFVDRTTTNPIDAFSHLNQIIPTKHNAWLFDKRIKARRYTYES